MVIETRMKNAMATVKPPCQTEIRTKGSTNTEKDTAMVRTASRTVPNMSASMSKAKSTAKARFGTQTARDTRVALWKIGEMATGFTTT